jgi:phosphate-selective porin OprO/OprP
MFVRLQLAAALLLGFATPTLAQAPPPASAESRQAPVAAFGSPQQAPPLVPQTATPPPTVPPFAIQTDNGDNRIQIGALLQIDGRFTIDAPLTNVVDTFAARRLRVPIQGRVARLFDFYFNPDFAGGAVAVRDAYFDTRFSNGFRIRVGKSKTPFGIERLHSASSLLFVERALPTAVAPDRDFGVQLQGDVFGNVVSYAFGVGNGIADGASADVDTNEGKDVSARIVVRPLANKTTNRLAGLGLALAGSGGDQPLTLPAFRSAGQQTFFAYANGATAAQGVGVRTRYSPQWFFYSGPFGGFGEWVRSTGDVQRGSAASLVRAEVDHTAWQIALSWVITGEAASEKGLRPRRNFDPGRSGGWGALQIAARYNELRVSQNAVDLGFAAAGASRTAEAWAVGANWYLNPFVKWVLNFERTVFDGDADGPRSAENAALFRAQLSF